MSSVTRAFTLPVGYRDAAGRVHRHGTMRLAQVRDELAARRDARVRGNPSYVAVLLMSRVVVELGDLRAEEITPETIENLAATDFAHLADLYREFHRVTLDRANRITCPHCGESFES